MFRTGQYLFQKIAGYPYLCSSGVFTGLNRIACGIAVTAFCEGLEKIRQAPYR